MNRIKNFFNNSADPEKPPPYDFTENANEHSEKGSVVINRQKLKEIRDNSINTRNAEIIQEISSIIKKCINDKIIRIVISFLTSPVIKDDLNFKIHSIESKLNLEITKYNKFCSCNFILVILHSEQDKNNIIQIISDVKLIRESVYPIEIIFDNIYDDKFFNGESLNDKYNLNIDKNIFHNSIEMFFSYEKLKANNNTELVKIYNKIINNSNIIKILQDKIIDSASKGRNNLIYTIPKAEFYYEYFKYNNTFEDIEIIIEGDTLFFLW